MVKIYTDSSANITPEESESIGVTVIPLNISFGDKEFRDGYEITADEFYNKLENSTVLPRSSQINITVFEDIFVHAKQKDETLLVILISSALSGTYSAALTAKENIGYEKIYIYDSLCATIMQKMLVIQAQKHSDKSPCEIVKILDDLRGRMELYAVVNTLEYLHRGGRLKKSTAIVGKLLHIKPLITISKKGTVELYGKAIGSKLAFKTIKKYADINNIDIDYPVYYVYSKNREKCEQLINQIHPNNNELINSASNLCPVIGVHIGPNAAGICFIRKKN